METILVASPPCLLSPCLPSCYQEQVTVVAHSRLTIDVDADLARQGASGAVSTLVQAQGTAAVLVAERPQYFAFNGGQGGTDVIGYTGG